jgi:hypothetical protein
MAATYNGKKKPNSPTEICACVGKTCRLSLQDIYSAWYPQKLVDIRGPLPHSMKVPYRTGNSNIHAAYSINRSYKHQSTLGYQNTLSQLPIIAAPFLS